MTTLNLVQGGKCERCEMPVYRKPRGKRPLNHDGKPHRRTCAASEGYAFPKSKWSLSRGGSSSVTRRRGPLRAGGGTPVDPWDAIIAEDYIEGASISCGDQDAMDRTIEEGLRDPFLLDHIKKEYRPVLLLIQKGVRLKGACEQVGLPYNTVRKYFLRLRQKPPPPVPVSGIESKLGAELAVHNETNKPTKSDTLAGLNKLFR